MPDQHPLTVLRAGSYNAARRALPTKRVLAFSIVMDEKGGLAPHRSNLDTPPVSAQSPALSHTALDHPNPSLGAIQ